MRMREREKEKDINSMKSDSDPEFDAVDQNYPTEMKSEPQIYIFGHECKFK